MTQESPSGSVYPSSPSHSKTEHWNSSEKPTSLPEPHQVAAAAAKGRQWAESKVRGEDLLEGEAENAEVVF